MPNYRDFDAARDEILENRPQFSLGGRRWIKLGEWNGTPATWTVPLKDVKMAGVDAVAVLLQSGTAARPGPMLGAAMTSLQVAEPVVAKPLAATR